MTGNSTVIRHDSSQKGLELLRNIDLDLIDIAPTPPLPGLVGGDHGMARVMGVAGSVTARRTVATTDVAAGQTQPEMDPLRARFQALLAPRSARRHGL